MLNVLSLFSGIGAFEKAMGRCNIDFELVNYCEIDKYASKAYSLIHAVEESKNLGDITKADTTKLKNIDIVTYGFPCQDISNAGKQKGFEDENGERTRSGLFFEALRIIEDTQPKFAICENVKALTSKKFEKEFQTVLDSLEAAGYSNYWQVLNSKDYGIPQNRERVFVISIRKDIDCGFIFPKPCPLELRLKDVLENKVDEKFYISEEVIKEKFVQMQPCETQECNIQQVGNYRKGNNFSNPQTGRVYSANGISPTINTCQGGDRQPKIVDPFIPVKNATKKGYIEAIEGDSINLQFPDSKTRRGRVGKQISQTLQCNDGMGVVVSDPVIIDDIYNNRPPRVYDKVAHTIRAERTGLKVAEPVPVQKNKKQFRGFVKG